MPVTSSASNLPLHALHLDHGAKIMPFAGYAMPLHYQHGIIHEHLHTRAQASLFDVSHMGQITIEGPVTALETLVPSDIAALGLGRLRYSVLTNDQGGICDDLMITRFADRVLVVVNAAFKAEDFAHLRARLDSRCEVRLHDDRALLALQGPVAASVLGAFDPCIGALYFMTAGEFRLNGIDCLVSRSGYTGEDGFEIALPAVAACDFALALLADPRVALAGLGARDSLRLEAGLCLAGTDIDEATTPVEAGLGWVIAKKYRVRADAPNFPGAAIILRQLESGCARVRVGLRPRGRVLFRAGLSLLSADGRGVGNVTSGGFAPSLDAPVAMGFVDREFAAPGTVLTAVVREREHTAEVVPLPFVPHRYHRP